MDNEDAYPYPTETWRRDPAFLREVERREDRAGISRDGEEIGGRMRVILWCDEEGLKAEVLGQTPLNDWLVARHGGLGDLRPSCRPKFVNRLPISYPEYAVIEGEFRLPQAVKSVTEWVLE